MILRTELAVLCTQDRACPTQFFSPGQLAVGTWIFRRHLTPEIDLSADFPALVLALLLNSPFAILAWERTLVVQDWMKKIAKSLSQKPTELIRNSKRQNSASDRHQLKLRSSVNFRGLKISPNNLLISTTLSVLNPLVWYL